VSKQPSDVTLLRSAKRENVQLRQALDKANLERHVYRERATKAEIEAADWRKRFALLLISLWTHF
jgi:hypothetical protein